MAETADYMARLAAAAGARDDAEQVFERAHLEAEIENLRSVDDDVEAKPARRLFGRARAVPQPG